jgi:competence protein ComEC
MKYPLPILALTFCSGIIFASQIKIPFLLVYPTAVIFLLLSAVFFKKRFIFDIFISLCVFLLGAGLLLNSQALAASHISQPVFYKNNQPVIVRGIVYSQPELKNNKLLFILKAKEVQSGNLRYNCCGNILVRLRGKTDLEYADELILSGHLRRPYGFTTKGQRGYQDYLANQGIYCLMNIKAANFLVKINKGKGMEIKRFAFWLKARLEELIFKYVLPVPAGILDAMLLGERSNIPSLINNSMVKSGTVHILVVSGFNTGLVSLIILSLLKLLRLSRNTRFYVTIPLLLLYCLLTGASNPVVRATIMTIVFLSSYLVKREPNIYNSCSLAAIIILGINPRQLFDAGFQLSFLSVFSLIYLYPKLRQFLRLERIKIRSIRFLSDSLLLSFSAWLGTMGCIIYYFRIFSPITVIANLFIIPLAALITLCGFSLVIIGFLFPYLAPFFASSSELAIAILLRVNALLIRIPGAYFSLQK